jgi:hypothetical protein
MGGECRAALVTINLILRRIALDLPNASLTIKEDSGQGITKVKIRIQKD